MTQLEALKAIAARDGGKLRPQAVVDAAKPIDSPLHGRFCWDDTEAARRYRIIQAQELIREFKVKIVSNDNTSIEVPMFVNLSSDRDGPSEENPYRLMEDVRKMPNLLKIAVRDALDQLVALRNRYSHLKELSDVWTVIDKVWQGNAGKVRQG